MRTRLDAVKTKSALAVDIAVASVDLGNPTFGFAWMPMWKKVSDVGPTLRSANTNYIAGMGAAVDRVVEAGTVGVVDDVEVAIGRTNS